MWVLVRPDALAVLRNKKAQRALSRYFDIFQDKRLAKFVIARRIPAEFDEESTLEELWALHNKLTERYYETEMKIDNGQLNPGEIESPKKSYLDLKISIAHKILQNCHFCERRCGINRLVGEMGYCKAGTQYLFSTAFEHLGEESELVPSGTIFSVCCNLKCKHCQNWTLSWNYEVGEPYTPERLARVVERLHAAGCRNCNEVGGSPTPWLHVWLETFSYVKPSVAQVWNSNSYYSEETAKLLSGFTDVYLLDFKYGSNECAKRISDAPHYWEACTRNHLYAKKYGELIIRILVLPAHLECCFRPMVEWIAKNLGSETRVNVMHQYRPEYRAREIPELRRRLSSEEMQRSIGIAHEVGLENLVKS